MRIDGIKNTALRRIALVLTAPICLLMVAVLIPVLIVINYAINRDAHGIIDSVWEEMKRCWSVKKPSA